MPDLGQYPFLSNGHNPVGAPYVDEEGVYHPGVGDDQTTEPVETPIIINTQPEGTDNYSASNYLLGAEPAVILSDDTERSTARISNTGTEAIQVGSLPGVSSRSAFLINAGQSLTVTTWRTIYAASASRTPTGTVAVSVWAERRLT